MSGTNLFTIFRCLSEGLTRAEAVTPNGNRGVQRRGDRLVVAERTTAVAGRAPCRRGVADRAHGHPYCLCPGASPRRTRLGLLPPVSVRGRLAAAFRNHPVKETRPFVLSDPKARSESKFDVDK